MFIKIIYREQPHLNDSLYENNFMSKLEKMDKGIRREQIAVSVRRSHIFEDSFDKLHTCSADEWKNRFYIIFEGNMIKLHLFHFMCE